MNCSATVPVGPTTLTVLKQLAMSGLNRQCALSQLVAAREVPEAVAAAKRKAVMSQTQHRLVDCLLSCPGNNPAGLSGDLMDHVANKVGNRNDGDIKASDAADNR
jgi:hypothetical protein